MSLGLDAWTLGLEARPSGTQKTHSLTSWGLFTRGASLSKYIAGSWCPLAAKNLMFVPLQIIVEAPAPNVM